MIVTAALIMSVFLVMANLYGRNMVNMYKLETILPF
jgi:hypothetical protein